MKLQATFCREVAPVRHLAKSFGVLQTKEESRISSGLKIFWKFCRPCAGSNYQRHSLCEEIAKITRRCLPDPPVSRSLNVQATAVYKTPPPKCLSAPNAPAGINFWEARRDEGTQA